MSAKVEILELLEAVHPEGRCDDCLSTELNIKPRQSVNIVCRPLHAAGKITRMKDACSLCGKVKLVNTLTTAGVIRQVEPRSAEPRRQVGRAPEIDIERARTDIVRMCRAIWQRSQSGEAPRSISAVILQLRTVGALPQHHANLMLTLCNLRNVHVYEDFRLGPHENAIAFHASAALSEWWASAGNDAQSR